MELGAEEAEEGRQQQEEPPVQKVKHSLLSKACRQLSVWMTAGRPSKEVRSIAHPFMQVLWYCNASIGGRDACKEHAPDESILLPHIHGAGSSPSRH